VNVIVVLLCIVKNWIGWFWKCLYDCWQSVFKWYHSNKCTSTARSYHCTAVFPDTSIFRSVDQDMVSIVAYLPHWCALRMSASGTACGATLSSGSRQTSLVSLSKQLVISCLICHEFDSPRFVSIAGTCVLRTSDRNCPNFSNFCTFVSVLKLDPYTRRRSRWKLSQELKGK